MASTIKITNPSKTCRRICKNRKAGLYLAQLMGREMDPFVPMDTGTLKDSYKSFNEPNVVTYKAGGYAPAMFYGKSKKGRPIHYSKDKHPRAGSRWDLALKRSGKMNKIAQEMTRYMKKV